MTQKKAANVTWRACQSALKTWPHAGLVSLVKELYELTPETAAFLRARVVADNSEGALADARKGIAKFLSYNRVINGHFRHTDVKQVVDRFCKATDDVAGEAQLLIFDIDETCAVFWEVGDYEPLVDHAYAQMKRLHECMGKLEAEKLSPLVDSLKTVADRWDGKFGYGLSDELNDLAAEWTDRLVKLLPTAAPALKSKEDQDD